MTGMDGGSQGRDQGLVDVSIASPSWELLALLSLLTTTVQKMKERNRAMATSQEKEQTLSEDCVGVFQGALDSAVVAELWPGNQGGK